MKEIAHQVGCLGAGDSFTDSLGYRKPVRTTFLVGPIVVNPADQCVEGYFHLTGVWLVPSVCGGADFVWNSVPFTGVHNLRDVEEIFHGRSLAIHDPLACCSGHW
jgi:hypothetical protein